MSGQKIRIENGKLQVPDNPIIPYIVGDGVGVDIWPAAQMVFDAAVEKAYNKTRKIEWVETLAGKKAFDEVGDWLPQATVDLINDCLFAIKGPLETPVGGGLRSLNVALRQQLDLYTCLRPVKYYPGVPSPNIYADKVDMVIFRENTEDIYAGIEYKTGSPEAEKLLAFLQNELGVKKIRFPESSSFGIKPISREGTMRLVREAIKFAIENNRKSVTLVHKGNIMKFTEGSFRDWGYELAKTEFGATEIDGGPWCQLPNGIIIKDSIADVFLQHLQLRPQDFDVIATMNLNGDYISDALAAMVGGIGIAPGANINYHTGHAVFEATHGTAPKHAGLDKVNPSSVILSGVVMLEYMGWKEAADLIEKGLTGAIAAKTVTYDFARLTEGATEVSCSGFARAIIANM